MTYRNRRSFIRTAGTVGALGLAGCLSNDGGSSPSDSSDNETNSSDGSDTGNGNETESPQDNSNGELDHLPGETLEDFESLDNWATLLDGGSIEATTDDPYAGSQSARLHAGENNESAGSSFMLPESMDLSNAAFSMAVKYSGREQLMITLEVLAPNARNKVALRRTLTGPVDRWVRVDFGTTNVDTSPDLTDVREFRVIAHRRGSNEGPIDFAIDDLRVTERPDQGSVLFLFDGTLESHHVNAFEHMESFGFAGVEAVIPEAVGETGRLTHDQMQDLEEAGWDMAARPRTGSRNINEFTREQQEGAMERTKKFLEHRGFEDGANYFVTPRNIMGPNTYDLVQDHYKVAFRYGGGPNGLPLTDPHNVGTFSGTAGSEVTRYIDYAAQYGQLAVIRFEEIGGADGMSEDAFVDLLEYVDSTDVQVVTASELSGDA
ncbi:polysaccharide deacetylase family protein [Natronosalvus rutilus]|uniref:Polysaccharide deacetylase n=1 Tax=Natronosalvus rutilus TaxID=2953753 RepID=A0A9E7SXJ3_9EURY|nr:hypothetical protein [Natronosalvus rutilus]UTF54163.1 hypothetical protein NGM29_02440 [Natronosalvus rutilus]